MKRRPVRLNSSDKCKKDQTSFSRFRFVESGEELFQKDHSKRLSFPMATAAGVKEVSQLHFFNRDMRHKSVVFFSYLQYNVYCLSLIANIYEEISTDGSVSLYRLGLFLTVTTPTI